MMRSAPWLGLALIVMALLSGIRIAESAPRNADSVASLVQAPLQTAILSVQCRSDLASSSETLPVTRLWAYVHALSGQCLTAQHEFEIIVQHDPDDQLAWLGLGSVRAALGDETGAIVPFKQAQAGDVVLALGERAVTQNETAVALKWLQIADRVTPSANTAFQLAMVYQTTGHPDQAKALLSDRLGQTAPDSADYWQLDALLSELQGDWSRALTAWDRLVQLKPDDYQVLMQAKAAAERAQDRERAIAITEHMIALQLGGEYGGWWMLEAARLETERGQYVKAFHWLERAQSINYQPAWVIPFYQGRTACAANDLKQAVDYFEQALRLSPDNYEVLAQWGECVYYLTGDATQAIPYLERAVQQAAGLPGVRDLRLTLGDWYVQTGNLPAARTQFDAILAQYPTDEVAVQRLKQIEP